MTLIKSISGIRGTIGGGTGDTLNPLDIVKFVTAYATFMRRSCGGKGSAAIVVGRDGRISGDMVRNVVCGTLLGCGFDVIDIGLASTPTTEMAVRMAGVLAIADAGDFCYADVDHLGAYRADDSYSLRHVEAVLALPLVDVEAVRKAGFRVCVDAINSVGGLILPALLDRLGVSYKMINGEPTGDFAHNPEPLEKNLGAIMGEVRGGGYDLGVVVDPDVDRLAFISEDGTMFGEEYTLVSVADYVLSHTPGSTVSNLSSTRALRDVTLRHGGSYAAAAVGEVNVVAKMKETGAVIGGEGNGGVIYPECHYGRDALVGIALFLSALAHKGCTASELRAGLPTYYMAKNRLDLTPDTDIDAILERVKRAYSGEKVNDIDGVKIDFADKWVHLRKSNTEPIIRIYSEAGTPEEAEAIAREVMSCALERK